PFGRVLRITKINEIPQIFNVLLGDMSFVGPRPLLEESFNRYPDNVKTNIYLSKPGITGIGSLIFRDEEKNISESDMPPHEYYSKFISPIKGRAELWYLENKSLKTDLLIIGLTIWILIFPTSKAMFRVFRNLDRHIYV
ncbi:MAG: lipid carrier : UDP-N-acetylgalactosaminyltransferase, partial [Chitinophagaceae bacterium]|nr:lipid carrier : UDP-N-acetylgalactosaminyltransferase [Chitinophagaceae bacterium]